METPVFWKWPPLFGCFIITCLADLLCQVYGVVRPSIEREYTELFDGNAEKAVVMASSIAAILVTLMLVLAPVGAGLVEKFGCRRVSIIASFLPLFGTSLSWILCDIYQIKGNIVFVLDLFAVGICGGTAVGLLFGPSTSALQKYFKPEQRGMATGIAAAGAPFAFLAFSYATHELAKNYSWRGVFLITGAVALNGVAAGLTYVDIDEPTDESPFSVDNVEFFGTKKDFLHGSLHINLFKEWHFVLALISTALSMACMSFFCFTIVASSSWANNLSYC